MATIPVGLTPTRLVLSRTGHRLYVVNGDSVSGIDPKTPQAWRRFR
jgi:DNA-binding beta-propeller fold protein YncE